MIDRVGGIPIYYQRGLMVPAPGMGSSNFAASPALPVFEGRHRVPLLERYVGGCKIGQDGHFAKAAKFVLVEEPR